jgi:hypothetical protein
MFFQKSQNGWLFLHGKESPQKAGDAAEECSFFQEDDEDEQVSDIFPSCYNCRYRRWTAESFICKKVK